MSKSVKIAYIFFQIAEKSNGGVISLYEIMTRIGEKGYSPVVFTQVESEINKQLRRQGVEVFVSPKGTYGSGVVNKLKFSYWLFKHMARLEIQLAHVNDIMAYLHSLLALKWLRIPIVFNVRDTLHPSKRKYGIHWRLLRYSSKVICLSESMQKDLISKLPLLVNQKNSDFVDFVYSIVDYERFRYVLNEGRKNILRTELNLPTDKFLIAYVAKFDEKKQQLKYIQNVVPDTGSDCCTVFIGDFDPLKHDYSRVCQHEFENLPKSCCWRVLGFKKEIENYYQACDVVVVPTMREGLARCMIEGISCGLPVISFDVCSAREILERSNTGVVIEQGDYDNFVSAIKKVNKKQADLADGKTTYDYAKSLFHEGAIMKRYDEIYQSVLKN